MRTHSLFPFGQKEQVSWDLNRGGVHVPPWWSGHGKK